MSLPLQHCLQSILAFTATAINAERIRIVQSNYRIIIIKADVYFVNQNKKEKGGVLIFICMET